MTLDRDAALSSLTDIETVERRTSQAMFYGIASSFLILWGAVTTAGYLLGLAWPRHAGTVWLALMVLGFAITIGLTRRSHTGLTARQSALGWRLVLAQIALLGFGVLVIATLGPFSGRQLDAYWPLLFMLGYVLAGIWVGYFFVLSGVVISLLTVAGFWWSGAWFPLWMAVVNGGGLLSGGLWLRRRGTSR
jgi:hypothetical protein